jgi:hypothetical protein
MAINSTKGNNPVSKSLTNAQVTSLVDAGLTAALIKSGLASGFTYQQLLNSASTTTSSYITSRQTTLKNALIALSGQNISDYATSNGFELETFNGIEYLKRTFATPGGSGTYTVPTLLSGLPCTVIVVGGGGGGGSLNGNVNSGGGAGGVVYRTNFAPTGTITLTIGSGGALGTNGSNTVFGDIVALGGGGGNQHESSIGLSGGSGGGGGYNHPGGSALQASSSSGGHGFNGGSGGGSGNMHPTGGGGGAGAVGESPTNNNYGRGGNGGIGIQLFNTYYAGGGGGGSWAGGGTSTGGAGGGGNGGGGNTQNASTAGTAGLGGGGGGGYTTGLGKFGGSGTVVLRYNLSYTG